MSLRLQLLLLQVAIVLITVVGTGVVASWLQEQQLRDAYRDRMIAIAQSVASLPTIIQAFDDPKPSETIQPIAELLRKASDLTYIVVANAEGIRYSHPNPARIGKHVSTDPSVPLSGEVYVGTQTGTLGETWRVKMPIFDASQKVIGVVSVGILESDLRKDYLGSSTLLFLTIGVAAILGVIGAAGVTSVIRRRTYGLEPEQIAGLLEEREAILHGVREGVLAVDEHGHIAVINDAAVRLLGISDSRDLVGLPAAEVLEDDLLPLLSDERTEQRLVLSGERVLVVRRDVASIDGRSIGTILILRDNTELHALMRDLDGVQGLADGLRSQAHGFANKLHVISGLLELDHVDEAVAFIAREGAGGTLTGVIGPTGIHDLEVGALLLVKQAQARELGVTVDVDPTSSLRQLAAGPASERLRDDVLTVLGNLVDNSLEACAYGGRIVVSLAEDPANGDGEGHVTVTVSDDGVGIPIERQERVFEAGYSSKSTNHGQLATGRGIGLTLVRRIAQRRGGFVRIHSAAGTGTRVDVRLPSEVE